jgi:putative heme-binding domain-containing protein
MMTRSRTLAGLALTALALLGVAARSEPKGQVGNPPNVPKDFKLELLYTVPGASEGSWVTMCVDSKGRLIVGDQNGKLYRVTLPPPDRQGTIRPEPIDLDIGGAHGLLYAFESLYVMVNEGPRPHGLYRLRDTDGDDRFDELKLLRPLEISGEHGGHSIVLAPDGKSLYVTVGNQSTLTRVSSSRVPFLWSEDNLVSRIPTGFMDNSLAPQGWIARTDPDGKEWELIAAGFRNEFDAAFNRLGDLFTYDADMEWDIGDPWYRPTRINHVVSGAEFGFRNGSGKWPEYFLDSFGAVLNVGPGSPTGVTFGYGAKFPAKYQETLFVADWSFGKIRAVHLSPSGASYRGEIEEFLSGQPLAVTDLVINPTDGAMYFVVGGRESQSALYRLTYVGKESTAPGTSDSSFGDKRALRTRLEQFHGRADRRALPVLWPYLGDADRAIRFAARTALEWQDPADWREKALSEPDPRRAIAALVALARMSGRDIWHRDAGTPAPDSILQNRMLAALDRIALPQLGAGDQLDLLRAYALVFTRLGPPGDGTRRRLIARFDPLVPAVTRDLNVQLVNLLVYLQSPALAQKGMALFRKAVTQEEQIEYALALRMLRAGWTQPLREEYFRWFVTTAAGYRGGNTFVRALNTIKREAVTNLAEEEKVALKPILDLLPESRSPQATLAARPLVKAWTVSELVPIVERGLNGPRDLERGHRLFAEVACAACHRFRDEGGSVGPDLTGVAGRFSVHDLIEAIVEPSKVISDQYAAIVIRKKDGAVVRGRVANLNGPVVQVVEDMLEPGKFTRIRREDIDSIENAKVSMMPPGLLNRLQPEEIQDLVAFLLSRGAARPDSSAQDADGFVAIFDGKSLNHWDGDTTFWRVEEGSIVGESTPSRRVTQNSFLIWRGGTTGDFELKLEYRLSPDANSGVQYRSLVPSNLGPWAMKGYQADLDGTNRYSGQIYEERGRGFLAVRGAFVRMRGTAAGGKQPIGSLGDDAALKALLNPGDWNLLHIIARGNLLIQLVNGRVMSALIDEDEQGRAAEGLLGLQIHAGPPMRIEFRNLRFKPL